MAAGNRNKKTNKRSDIARHYSLVNGGIPICETKGFGYSTNDIEDVDCLKCKNKIDSKNKK